MGFKPRDDISPEETKALWEEMNYPSLQLLSKEIERRFGVVISQWTLKDRRKKWGDPRKKREEQDIIVLLDAAGDAERLKITNREVGKAVARGANYFHKYCHLMAAADPRAAGEFLFKVVRGHEIYVTTADKVPMIAERAMKLVDDPGLRTPAADANGAAAKPLEHDPLEDQRPVLARALALVKG
jgi:hypothetical protein